MTDSSVAFVENDWKHGALELLLLLEHRSE